MMRDISDLGTMLAELLGMIEIAYDMGRRVLTLS